MPGPLLTYNINQSIRVGIRAGLLLIIGHAILEIITISLLFLGLGTYLSTNIAQIVIGAAGGTLLIIFGVLMVKDVIKGQAKFNMVEKGKERSGSLIINGIIISFLNPYFIIWWTVVGLGLMMAAYNAFGVGGIVAFFTGHIMADFSWYILVSYLVSRTRRIMNEKAYKIILVILALTLIGFGINFFIHAGIKLFT